MEKISIFFTDVDFRLILILMSLIFIILLFIEIISKKNFKIKKYIKNNELKSELYRKAPHVLIGIVFLRALFILSYKEMILFSFFVFLASIFNNYLNFFSAIKKIKRFSLGIYLFPLSVMLMTLLFFNQKIVFLFGLSILIFSDAIAAILGKSFGKKRFFDKKTIIGIKNQKTYIGTLSFFIMTLIFFLFFKYIDGELFFKLNSLKQIIFVLLNGVLISFLLSFLELFLFFGFDNLFLPIIASYLFLIF